MRILIIGAGAIGTLLGAYLSKENEISFVTRRKEQAEHIAGDGCRVQRINGEEIQYFPHAYHWEQYTGDQEYDVALITTKQNHLAELLTKIEERISERLPLLFLLNGLGHIELIKSQLSHHTIYTGITQCGAIKQSDELVEERGIGDIVIGDIASQDKEQDRFPHPAFHLLVEQFKKQDITMLITEHIELSMLKKCIINACINPLTALFGVFNGELIANDHLRSMMKQVYEETVMLLEQASPQLLNQLNKGGELWEEIIKVCRNTSMNQSSMLQDVQNNRLTELDSITGYFLSIASEHKISMPHHQFLYDAIRIKETLYS